MGLARAVPARIAVVVLTERGGRAELADVGEREMRQGHSRVTLTDQKLEFEISKGRYVCPPRRGCPRACCGVRAPRLHLWTAPPLSMWNIRRRVGAGRPCSAAAGSLVTKCGLRTWQFVDAKAGDGSSAAAWVWGMAVHPPVTRAMAVRARS